MAHVSAVGIMGNFKDSGFVVFDSAELDRFIDSFPLFHKFKKDVRSFYRTRGYSFAWYDDLGLLETADNLFNMIINIEEEGLPSKILYKDAFSAMMSADAGKIPSPILDLMLTAQYLN